MAQSGGGSITSSWKAPTGLPGVDWTIRRPPVAATRACAAAIVAASTHAASSTTTRAQL